MNGATGIAVGMATSIPPHNPVEILDAAIAAIDDPEADPLRFVRGPDFPTGGQLLSTKKELREIYESGQGTLKLRAEYEIEERNRGAQAIVVTSVPYGVAKASLVEKIAEVIIARKLPALVDVRDESTDDVRVVLELKRDADPALVMSYLYKHTPLQTTVPVNLTVLVPTANPEVAEPARLSLSAILRHFLDFRFETVRRRFVYELEELLRRIHLLEGFEKIFDELDEAIRIIRRSDGKADAAGKLMKRFGLDDEQADAVLETKLYKLARLEIESIRKELAEKRAEAARIEAILKSPAKLWGVVQRELVELRGVLSGEKRKTRVSVAVEEPEYDAEAFIPDEDAFAVVTVDGWLKRLGQLKDPKQTRMREGDDVLAVLQGGTRELVVLFSNRGSAYVLRMNDVPPSTGYGEPVQKLFKFGDGERVVAALSLDPRVTPEQGRRPPRRDPRRHGPPLLHRPAPRGDHPLRAPVRQARGGGRGRVGRGLRGGGDRRAGVREGAGDPLRLGRGPRPRRTGEGRHRDPPRRGRPGHRRHALRQGREARRPDPRELEGDDPHRHAPSRRRRERWQGLRADQARPLREGGPARDRPARSPRAVRRRREVAVEVVLAEKYGFCAGVRVADKLVRIAAAKGQSGAILGQVVHNESVESEMATLGFPTVHRLEDAHEHAGRIVFSAHGVAPSVRAEAAALGLTAIDTTCKFVTDIHREIARSLDDGCFIAVLGQKGHREVIGYTKDLDPARYGVFYDLEEVRAFPWEAHPKVKVVFQTTLNADGFAAHVEPRCAAGFPT